MLGGGSRGWCVFEDCIYYHVSRQSSHRLLQAFQRYIIDISVEDPAIQKQILITLQKYIVGGYACNLASVFLIPWNSFRDDSSSLKIVKTRNLVY